MRFVILKKSRLLSAVDVIIYIYIYIYLAVMCGFHRLQLDIYQHYENYGNVLDNLGTSWIPIVPSIINKIDTSI